MHCSCSKSKLIYIILGFVSITIIIVLAVNAIKKPPAQTIEPTESAANTPVQIVSLPISDTVENKIMKWDNPPQIIIDKNAKYTAIVKTNQGDIEIELFVKENPITVNNFVFLAQQGFYNGLIFHRVINGFMIQGGCPLGKGIGGPGYLIPDEFKPGNRNDRGTISMANAGPNTGGSQFFINLVDNNFLDTRHPAFGRVIKGMEIVEAIGRVETGPGDRPINNVVMNSIEIISE